MKQGIKYTPEPYPGKSTFITSYRRIEDYDKETDKLIKYDTGIYKGKEGPVVVSIIKRDYGTTEWLQKVLPNLKGILNGIYGRVDSEDLKHLYLYSGQLFEDMKYDIKDIQEFTENGKKLTFLTCSCNYENKISIARDINLPLRLTHCGGRSDLAKIVNENLE